MTMFKRVLFMLACAALLVLPLASTAEELGFSAGDLTLTAIEESYAAGEQLDMTLGFSAYCAVEDEKAQALMNLLGMSELQLSAYDDFGTTYLRGRLVTDGVTLFSASALVYEDGSVMVMTSLTGKTVFAIPADMIGVNQDEEINFSGIELGSDEYYAMSLRNRTLYIVNDAMSLLLNHLLGWTSGTQQLTGELYSFDYESIDPTETRDGVETRMIGIIEAYDFNQFILHVLDTLRCTHFEYHELIAEYGAMAGVTRYQYRQLIDGLFPDEVLDPSVECIESTSSIPDDGALLEADDIEYTLKKLYHVAEKMVDASTSETLGLVVSYNEDSEMVGFDADMPRFTEVLPYEGMFTYSLKTDDYEQKSHIAHGEMQVYDDNRIIGNLAVLLGQPVGSVKASSLSGNIGVAHQGGELVGLDIDAGLVWTADGHIDEADVERFEAQGEIAFAGAQLAQCIVTGKTAYGDNGLMMNATATANLADQLSLSAEITLTTSEYDEQTFEGGRVLDVSQMDADAMNSVVGDVVSNAAKLAPVLLFHGNVMSNVMTLIGE